MGRIRVTQSMSCSEPMSHKIFGPAPPMTTMGIPARWALATAVTTSVTPGPAVTAHTPGRPVTRAYPSAACPAVCSCRTSTTWIFSSMQPS
jgi:hypothetical protein